MCVFPVVCTRWAGCPTRGKPPGRSARATPNGGSPRRTTRRISISTRRRSTSCRRWWAGPGEARIRSGRRLATVAPMSEAEAPKKDHSPPAGAEVEQTWTSLDGASITYTASAGWMVLRKNDKPAAEVFSIAYVAAGPPVRPVTFVFNGGPGASSAYLHMGTVGPRAPTGCNVKASNCRTFPWPCRERS